MRILVMVLPWVLGQAEIDRRLPERIRKVIEERTTETSYLEWTLDHRGDQLGWMPFIEHYITQVSGASLWQQNTGDANGQHPIELQAFTKGQEEGELGERSRVFVWPKQSRPKNTAR